MILKAAKRMANENQELASAIRRMHQAIENSAAKLTAALIQRNK
jgi:hypothetical protein